MLSRLFSGFRILAGLNYENEQEKRQKGITRSRNISAALTPGYPPNVPIFLESLLTICKTRISFMHQTTCATE